MDKTWIWILIILVLSILGIMVYLSVFGEKTASEEGGGIEDNVSEVIGEAETFGEVVNETGVESNASEAGIEENISEDNNTQ